MAWVGVITNGGAELMRDWVAGKLLTLTTAKAGTDVYSEASLMSQTTLKSVKSDALIASARRTDAGLKVKIQVNPIAAGYVLNQIGIYAKLDDGQPVLIGLFQDADGVNIPAAAEAPDFEFTFYTVLAVSNVNDFTFSVDPSTVVTIADLAETVNKQKFVTIPVDGWETVTTDADEYYMQEIEVTGMKANMNPYYELVPSDITVTDLDTIREEKFGFSYICDIITSADKITVYCETDKPSVDIKIRLSNLSEKEDADGQML